MQRHDWFVSINLVDTYFHISIHGRFLPFACCGRAYNYRDLCGFLLALRVFREYVKATLSLSSGIWIFAYIDDVQLCYNSTMDISHLRVLCLFFFSINCAMTQVIPLQCTKYFVLK